MPTPRDPDAHHQARLERDPHAPDHRLPAHHQSRWQTPDPDPHGIDPVALGVMLSQLPADDPSYVAARLAVEMREQRRTDVESAIAMSEHAKASRGSDYQHITHAELERRRSTFDGVLDEQHLALRADPDRARRRRRAA